MFKKFEPKGKTLLKSSSQRHVKQAVVEQMPRIDYDYVVEKKQVYQSKFDRILLFSTEKIIFFQYEEFTCPTLLVLHCQPDILPIVQVDRGAIKFVLNGADIMCPGLTSKGADLPIDLPENTIVQVRAEGKEHALAIGILKMSTQEIKSKNKGIGIMNLHYLNDALYSSLFS